MVDYEKILRDFVKAAKCAQTEHRHYYSKVGELDKTTQDILHQIELGKPDDRNKWATQLSTVRKERRIAKDLLALAEPLKKYADENQAQIKAIERLLGDVRREQRLMKDRKYSPRILRNLTIDCWE